MKILPDLLHLGQGIEWSGGTVTGRGDDSIAPDRYFTHNGFGIAEKVAINEDLVGGGVGQSVLMF